MRKKYFLYIFSFYLLVSTSFATTYYRTEDNLLVDKNIKITDYNKHIILTTPKVDETKKIYDFANLFTSSEEELLYKDTINFISKSNLDMVIVTINDNPRGLAMNYADDFYDYNNFGIGSTYDGLLFLIDMDTREMWISTTGNAISEYNDYKIDKILDATYSRISKEDYYGCASKFIEKSLYYYEKGISTDNKVLTTDIVVIFVVIIFVGSISFAITYFIMIYMKSKHKNVKRATTAWSYMHSPIITYRKDTFLTTNIAEIYDPQTSHSESEGSSSTSTHSGSSGITHGGGGRGF